MMKKKSRDSMKAKRVKAYAQTFKDVISGNKNLPCSHTVYEQIKQTCSISNFQNNLYSKLTF